LALTPAQSRIEDLLISGKKVAEIQALLGWSYGQVNRNMRVLYEKRGVHSVVELILTTCDVTRKS
jgi:DNA-binding CsgD family transcriptional regulator